MGWIWQSWIFRNSFSADSGSDFWQPFCFRWSTHLLSDAFNLAHLFSVFLVFMGTERNSSPAGPVWQNNEYSHLDTSIFLFPSRACLKLLNYLGWLIFFVWFWGQSSCSVDVFSHSKAIASAISCLPLSYFSEVPVLIVIFFINNETEQKNTPQKSHNPEI